MEMRLHFFILTIGCIILSGCVSDKYGAGITCEDANWGAVLFGSGDPENSFKLVCYEICAKHNVKPAGSYSCDPKTGEILCSCQTGGLSDEDLVKKRECGRDFGILGQVDPNQFKGLQFGDNEVEPIFDNVDIFRKYVKNPYVSIEKNEEEKTVTMFLNFDYNESIKEACIQINIIGIKQRIDEYCQDLEQDQTPPGIIIPIVVKDGREITRDVFLNMLLKAKFKITPECG